jgi:hypothetical protein
MRIERLDPALEVGITMQALAVRQINELPVSEYKRLSALWIAP